VGETAIPVASLMRFGVFELDLRAGELRKNGAKLKLEGQPLQVLALLLDNPGQLVSREELRSKLWPDDTFVDFEHSINTAVKKLRQALDDSAETPRFIETLPRRGYRFIYPIGNGNEEPAAPAAKVRVRPYALVGFGVALLKARGRIDRRMLIGVIAGIVLAEAALIAVNMGVWPERQSHVGRTMLQAREGGAGVLLSMAITKIAMNLGLILQYWWGLALFIVPVTAVIFLSRQVASLQEMLRRHPLINGSAIGGLAAAVVGLLLNDTGIVMAIVIVLYVIAPVLLLAWEEDAHQQALGVTGRYSDPASDVAENHDHYLTEVYRN
jgi:DNA-binding winged helix-turn-helix (wHTH) protein